jgi:phenolic acid decarboxylase
MHAHPVAINTTSKAVFADFLSTLTVLLVLYVLASTAQAGSSVVQDVQLSTFEVFGAICILMWVCDHNSAFAPYMGSHF